MSIDSEPAIPRLRRSWSDFAFRLTIATLATGPILLIGALLLASSAQLNCASVKEVASNGTIRFSLLLTLYSTTLASILAVWTGIPLGYLLARNRFWLRPIFRVLIDVPLILPPLVLGLGLLLLFSTKVGSSSLDNWISWIFSDALCEYQRSS